MKSYVAFYNGQKMPIFGLGTWQCTEQGDVQSALEEALNVGYRHIDTAYVYSNEKSIGTVLKKWLESGKVKREELFITTKLPGIGMHKDRVEHFLKLSLQNLQLDYVDLYLIHSPVGIKYVNDTELYPKVDEKPGSGVNFDITTNLNEIWKAMEDQVDKGRTKSIGLSNFNSKQIERIVNMARIPPSNLQVELHAYFQQKPLREICKKNNITVCAYGPIGSPGRTTYFKTLGLDFQAPELLDDPVVVEIAKKYNKTAAQVLLRFLAQNEVVVIPKSSSPARIKENFQIFDFELNESDMKNLEELDKGVNGRTFKFSLWGNLGEHPENPEAIEF